MNTPFVKEIVRNDNVRNTIFDMSILSNQTVEVTKGVYSDLSLSNLFLLYAIITALLLVKFCFNLYSLLSGRLVLDRVLYNGEKLALVDIKISPFSFLRTIYINRETFDNGKIDHELVLHESGHVSQLHSLDIIFLELAQVFYWFNPFVFLFKKLIKVNHEYLADEFVVKSGSSNIDYSNKLINYTSLGKTLNLASAFNYSLIKNRLIMLSKYGQKRPIFYRLSLFASIIVTLFITTAFSNPENVSIGLIDKQEQGFFYADTLFWSEEDQKVYLKGNVKVKYGQNDFKGEGSFSFLGKVNLLIIYDRPATLNSSIELSGKKYEIITLSEKEAQKKYGSKGEFGAVEIKILK